MGDACGIYGCFDRNNFCLANPTEIDGGICSGCECVTGRVRFSEGHFGNEYRGDN